MRKSVLAGLLMCAVFFAPSQAGALTQEGDLLDVPEVESPALQLAVVVDDLQLEVERITEEQEANAPVVHIVEKAETLHSIAEQHGTDWKRIYDKNTSIDDPDVISEGEELEIPAEDEDVQEREIVAAQPQQPTAVPQPVRTASTTAQVASTPAPAPVRPAVQPASSRATAHSGWFPAGQCTHYVASRRPVGQWNNASQWFSQAQRDGWATGYTARAGAAAVSKSGNHVAYVEKVQGDQVYISERNYDWNGSYRERWAPASNYKYIY